MPAPAAAAVPYDKERWEFAYHGRLRIWVVQLVKYNWMETAYYPDFDSFSRMEIICSSNTNIDMTSQEEPRVYIHVLVLQDCRKLYQL